MQSQHSLRLEGGCKPTRIARRLHGIEYTDQCKIRRTTPDVANQDALTRSEQLVPISLMAIEPSIERRLRLFDQQHVLQSGSLCGSVRKLPCDLIERSGKRDYDFLFR